MVEQETDCEGHLNADMPFKRKNNHIKELAMYGARLLIMDYVFYYSI